MRRARGVCQLRRVSCPPRRRRAAPRAPRRARRRPRAGRVRRAVSGASRRRSCLPAAYLQLQPRQVGNRPTASPVPQVDSAAPSRPPGTAPLHLLSSRSIPLRRPALRARLRCISCSSGRFRCAVPPSGHGSAASPVPRVDSAAPSRPPGTAPLHLRLPLGDEVRRVRSRRLCRRAARRARRPHAARSRAHAAPRARSPRAARSAAPR